MGRYQAGFVEVLRETVIDDQGKKLAVRTRCRGTCGRVFQAVKVALPRLVREV